MKQASKQVSEKSVLFLRYVFWIGTCQGSNRLAALSFADGMPEYNKPPTFRRHGLERMGNRAKSGEQRNHDTVVVGLHAPSLRRHCLLWHISRHRM